MMLENVRFQVISDYQRILPLITNLVLQAAFSFKSVLVKMAQEEEIVTIMKTEEIKEITFVKLKRKRDL